MFLMKLSAFLATKLDGLVGGDSKEMLAFGTMVVVQLFSAVTSRNTGFGEFGQIGSFHKKAQDYFMEIIWDVIKGNLFDFDTAIAEHQPSVSLDNFQPYIMRSGHPNVFSFFHLAYQSLHYDFVNPFLLH
jgi:hypothetical protein